MSSPPSDESPPFPSAADAMSANTLPPPPTITHPHRQPTPGSPSGDDLSSLNPGDPEDEDEDAGYEDMSASVRHPGANDDSAAAPYPTGQAGARSPIAREAPSQGDDDDLEYAGEDLGDEGRGGKGSKRKSVGRKAKKGRKSASDAADERPHKKQKKSFTSSAWLESLDADAQARVKEMNEEMDKVLKTSNRGSKNNDNPLILEQIATRFLDRMKDAAARDVDAHERNEPALHKLRLLPILVQHLERKELCDVMLDHHILEGFMAWLEPFPADGSLPLYEIRKTLFALLLKMPITVDHLREDRIGPLVRFYEGFPRETTEIRRMAKEVAEKWMRPLMNLPSSMRNIGESGERVRVTEDLEAQARRRVLNRSSASGEGGSQSGLGSGASQLMSQGGSSQSQLGSQSGQRLRLPPTRGVGYTVRPEDNVPESHAANRRKEQGGLAKVVAKLKGPTSKRG